MPVALPANALLKLDKAIRKTFPTVVQFQTVLPQILEDMEQQDNPMLRLPARPYAEATWLLVKTWNGHGLITDLIGGLLRAAPASPSLLELQQGDLKSFSAVETAQLQGFVSPAWTHLPAEKWISTLQKRIGGLCRVDINGWDPPGVGTGFLVAPDLVLTAHHVIEKLPREDLLLAETAVCRFSYLDDVAKQGTIVPFSVPGWRVERSLPGGIELFPGGPEPTANQLDFALVRLREPVEAEPLPVAAAAATDQAPIVVLQHPRRLPLRIAFGQVTGFNLGSTRLKHNAGTEKGSSGAPCLDQNLEVVGLHNGTRYLPQGELSQYNTAIPIHRIEQALAAKDVRLCRDAP